MAKYSTTIKAVVVTYVLDGKKVSAVWNAVANADAERVEVILAERIFQSNRVAALADAVAAFRAQELRPLVGAALRAHNIDLAERDDCGLTVNVLDIRIERSK